MIPSLAYRLHLSLVAHDALHAHARRDPREPRAHDVGVHGARVVDDGAHEDREDDLRQEVGAVEGREVRAEPSRRRHGARAEQRVVKVELHGGKRKKNKNEIK